MQTISFRSSCPHCFSDLHVCKTCKNYAMNKPNECDIADIEPVREKDKRNFCEEFCYQNPSKHEKSKNPSEISKKLFGEDLEIKKSFKDLFKDK